MKRLVASVVAVTGLLLAAPAPARAAEPPVSVHMRDLTVPASGEPVIAGPAVWTDQYAEWADASVTYDYRDLTEVVTLEASGNYPCQTVEPGVLRCDFYPDLAFLPTRLPQVIAGAESFQATFRPIAAGTGTLRTTFSAFRVPPKTVTSRVRVGDAVALRVAAEVAATAAYGEPFGLPVTVRNDGSVAVAGVRVVVEDFRWMRAGSPRFANCTYVGDELRTCAFDQVLEPGRSYSATLPLRLADDAQAPSDTTVDLRWMTRASFEDYAKRLARFDVPIGRPGAAGRLSLTTGGVPAAPATGDAVQAIDDPAAGHSTVDVAITGDNRADLAAIGDRISGPVGAVRTVVVGYRNVGTASVVGYATNDPRQTVQVTNVDVDVPAGTTVVRAPARCAPRKGLLPDGWSPGAAGARAYRCYTRPDVVVGGSERFRFALRIDRARPAAGAVRVNVRCGCPTDSDYVDDTNPANDSAEILVNPDDGGPLPITGPATGRLIGTGALALLIGAILVLVTRRRVRPASAGRGR